jgi:hypothetical protein
LTIDTSRIMVPEIKTIYNFYYNNFKFINYNERRYL